jgi:hypothetical protein
MNLMQEIDRVGDELKFTDEKKRRYVFEIGENHVTLATPFKGRCCFQGLVQAQSKDSKGRAID